MLRKIDQKALKSFELYWFGWIIVAEKLLLDFLIGTIKNAF